MANHQRLAGVYAAALTPLKIDGSLALDDLLPYMDFLANRGCHGILLLGTTGEGPSFAPNERVALLRAALEIRQTQPQLKLLAGTGTPSLEETLILTRTAFDIGFDGVVVLPPYYFRGATDNGLFAWFSQVIQGAVPPGGAFFVYHIPGVSGVPLSLDLLARLKESFPDRFAGIKDSSGDPEHANAIGERFNKDILTLNGNDKLLSHSLSYDGAGAITALANLRSPDLRRIWDSFQGDSPDPDTQSKLSAARTVMDKYAPFPPVLKSLLAKQYSFPLWSVKPPLMPLSEHIVERANAELEAIDDE
jgi:4-hydroxy-tetrahydrodipicolinate synthase